jgi:hypothetical protein
MDGKKQNVATTVAKVISICSALLFVICSCVENYMEARFNDIVLQDLEDIIED